MKNPYMMKCKYECRKKDHIYCERDGSIRKRGCPCEHHALSVWSRFKMWFFYGEKYENS